MAEKGDFPALLGKIHPKYRTPYVSIMLYAAIVLVFAVLGDFRWNATLSAASRLAIYGAMAIAVPVLRSRRDDKAQFEIPVPYLFAGLALLFSVVLLTQMGRGEFFVVAATCALALLNWLFVRRKR